MSAAGPGSAGAGAGAGAGEASASSVGARADQCQPDRSLPLRDRFEALVVGVVQGIPDHAEADGRNLRELVAERLDAAFQKPKVEAVRSLLSKPDLSVDDVRELLFFPTPDDMKLYPTLITPPDGEVLRDTAALGKQVYVHFLSLLYLRHVRHWPLVDPFIREGGLPALVGLLSHKSPHLRSQAIDIFVQITANDAFDWFTPPTDATMELHNQMLSLALPQATDGSYVAWYVHKPFFQTLLEDNYSCEFTGGSFFALQIMAFWLSWARLRHTSQFALCLSRKSLEVLKRWSERTESNIQKEERELATQLHEDFARFTTLEQLEESVVKRTGSDSIMSLGRHGDISSGRYISVFSLDGGGDRTSLSVQVPQVKMPTPAVPANTAAAKTAPSPAPASDPAADATGSSSAAPTYKPATKPSQRAVAPPPPPAAALTPAAPRDPIQAAKAEGNSLYGKGKLHKAIRAYNKAIALATDRPAKVEGDYATVASALYANRAAAYLRRARRPGSKVAASKQDLLDCVADCDKALDLRPGYFKVLYRRAQALLYLGRLHESLADARQCVHVAASADDCDEATLADVQAFEAKVTAKLHAAQEAEVAAFDGLAPEEEGLAGSILGQLLRRTDADRDTSRDQISAPTRPKDEAQAGGAGGASASGAGVAAGGTASLPASAKTMAQLADDLQRGVLDGDSAGAGGGAAAGERAHRASRAGRGRAEREAAAASSGGVATWQEVAAARARSNGKGKGKKAGGGKGGKGAGASDGASGTASSKGKLGPKKAARLLAQIRKLAVTKRDYDAALVKLVAVPVALYPKLFKDSLDDVLFAGLIATLQHAVTNDAAACTTVAEVLAGLPAVARFNTMVKLLGAKQKAAVAALFAAVEGALAARAAEAGDPDVSMPSWWAGTAAQFGVGDA